MSRWFNMLRSRRLVALGAVFALLLAILVCWGLLAPHADPLVEAIRKRGYPVSMSELDAWYPSVPAAENAALVYTNAFALLTNYDGPSSNILARGWLPPLGEGLSAEEIGELKVALEANQAALRLLYSAPASGRSRYPVHMVEGFSMMLPHLAKMREATSLLTVEALMHATEGDAEKTTQAFLAAGRVAESVATEPLIISQLVRYANWGILLPRLERALTLTTFTDGQLASLQQAVEAAEGPRGMARALAAERACGVAIFTDRKAMAMGMQGIQNSSKQMGLLKASAFMTLLRITGVLQEDKAYYLNAMGTYVDTTELAYPARLTAGQHATANTNLPGRFLIFSRMLLPALTKMHAKDAEHVARIRAATAVLAVERFRLAHARALPDNLEQLTPNCVKALPLDPCDGGALRYKTNGPSYIVYSVGVDARDDGGVDWHSNYLKIPQDIGFLIKR